MARIPKRIRLGIPQKPHGKPSMRLLSYQREWLERSDAAYLETAAAAHELHVKEILSRPAPTFVDFLENRMEAAEAGMVFSLETQMFYNVDMRLMPMEPPADA